MLNLRFKSVVISTIPYGLVWIAKANKMIKNAYKHTEEELYEFAMVIVRFLAKRARTACALKAKKPIVPVAIYDSYKAMNSNTFEKVVTEVHFLEPILYEEYDCLKKNEVAELVKARIESKIKEIERKKTNLSSQEVFVFFL